MRMQSRFPLPGILAGLILTVSVSSAIRADEQTTKAKKSPATGPVYILTCPEDRSLLSRPKAGDDWKELHRQLDKRACAIIQVVDRSKVDESLFVDASGIRLYADSTECRDLFGSLTQESESGLTMSWLVRDLLGRRYAETGVEPGMIPINNSIAKTCGTEGMVRIKPGEVERKAHYYTSQSAELGERTGEKYRVKVPAFFIDKYKVTNAEYCEFLNAGNPGYWNWAPWNRAITRNDKGSFVVAKGQEKHPVVGVNWYQATGFAKWKGRSLPTEAQWEFAAGGAEGRTYPWGNEAPDKTRGHFVGKEYADVDAHPAGATPEGVFDLAGNAAEWCADFFDAAYYETAPEDGVLANATGPKTGSKEWRYDRMFKGFCRTTDTPEFLQCTKRHSRPPLLTSAISFRTVKGCG